MRAKKLDEETSELAVGAIVADFNSVRAEIIAKDTHRINLVSFYVTALGVAIGLALTDKSRIEILLIVPILSSAFGFLVIAEGRDKSKSSSYIDEVLRPLVVERTGDDRLLGWEEYYHRDFEDPFFAKALAMAFLFPGAALAALIITARSADSFAIWAFWSFDLIMLAILALVSWPRIKARIAKTRA